ncbi:uncharacterized protein C8R40DRAFT_1036911 [Lentinula edodes]|uniref:uncharacterized protein n=1 Tax=Lentinula edodes TaxID=5353 RepID=UPI001E8D1389|nr:uncharacterized protein C8R40DRAFT_1036911 [Lentinula edodes]KAH7878817.1 hypothetical protein C8R40DRAFT_1036911 [Lentinula edodes]
MSASYTSPSCYLMWALLSCTLFAFLIYHLYSFDRFKCLKWNDGPHSGAFKRVMTYSYFLTIPLFMVYAVGFSVIKYKEGYIALPSVGIVPAPYDTWSPTARSFHFPLMLCFAIAWSLEMVTHLQELCFWLFLVSADADRNHWFSSHYFKAWIMGSIFAILYMPIIAICTRENALKATCTFLAGSLGSLLLTILFMPILRKLPALLDNLRAEGADDGTIIRLTKFHELNTIRVTFRYLFTIPLLILGSSGLNPPQHVTGNTFWSDLCAFAAAIGCTASSGITLIIFFPRSVESEVSRQSARQRESESCQSKSPDLDLSSKQYVISTSSETVAMGKCVTITRPPPIRPNRLREEDVELGGIGTPPPHYGIPNVPSMQPNRKTGDEVELGGILSPASTTLNFSDVEPSGRSNNHTFVNSTIYSYTSPISCVLLHPSCVNMN